MIKELVSVIIPMHKNAEEQVKKCIKSVECSSYRDFEIIIIDIEKERSEQRNYGIAMAKGEFLLFLDSDQTVHPDLIQDCVNRIKYFGGIYIPEIVVGDDWFAKLRNWERQFYTGTLIDVCRFVRAYQCPKFDEAQNGPEDSDWDRRIQGGKTVSHSCVYHHENVTLWQWLSKKTYYARSMRRFTMRNQGDKILDWRWRCFGVFFERNGWKRVLKRPDLMIAIWCLIFIRGIIYLRRR